MSEQELSGRQTWGYLAVIGAVIAGAIIFGAQEEDEALKAAVRSAYGAAISAFRTETVGQRLSRECKSIVESAGHLPDFPEYPSMVSSCILRRGTSGQ
jgi:hypothetical protein